MISQLQPIMNADISLVFNTFVYSKHVFFIYVFTVAHFSLQRTTGLTGIHAKGITRQI